MGSMSCGTASDVEDDGDDEVDGGSGNEGEFGGKGRTSRQDLFASLLAQRLDDTNI